VCLRFSTPFATAALLLLLAMLSCRTMPMLTYPAFAAADDPAVTRAAILDGMRKYNWQVREEKPGQIDAALHLREHFLLVRISYDDEQIRTDYLDSRNLLCERRGDTCFRIHKSYNTWMTNLRRAIASGVSVSRSSPTAARPGGPEPL